MSCTFERVRARGGADRAALAGGERDEAAELVHERLLRGGDDRHLHAEGLLGAALRLVVEEGDDRLPHRHRLDREDAVPAGVQLVDDDVGLGEAALRLLVREALDDVEVDVELRGRPR